MGFQSKCLPLRADKRFNSPAAMGKFYELLRLRRFERGDHQRVNAANDQASNRPKPGTGALIFSVRITHHSAAAVDATTGRRVSFSNSWT